MGKIIKVRLTEYTPFRKGMMQGGILDRKGKPLYSLEDFLDGKSPYVSLACDSQGGSPGNVSEFCKYGYKVELPEINKKYERPIEFCLVDTGGHFLGKNKVVKVAGHEPINICRRDKPEKGDSFSGMLTILTLIELPDSM